MFRDRYKKGLSILTIAIGTVLLPVYVALAEDSSGGIRNPLGDTKISDILTNIIQWLLGLVAMLALLALIVGGVRIMTAFGNEQQVAAGKKIILWAIIGLAVVLGAYAIITLISSTILGVT